MPCPSRTFHKWASGTWACVKSGAVAFDRLDGQTGYIGLHRATLTVRCAFKGSRGSHWCADVTSSLPPMNNTPLISNMFSRKPAVQQSPY